MLGLVRQNSTVYWVSAFFSLFFSALLYYQETVINPDAICYLKSAAAMSSGLHYAMQLCSQAKWPFFSIVIFCVVKITHLSYEIAAYSVDAIFSLISVLFFIKIIEFISKSSSHVKQINTILWLAAALILLSHEFNAVRQYIIRDHGFWAFYLISIYSLLHYVKHCRWQYAMGWSMSIILATLFRIEGAIFLLVIPFFTLCDNRFGFFKRITIFLELNIITLLAVGFIVTYLLFHPEKELTRISEVVFQFSHAYQVIVHHFVEMKEALATSVLGSNAASQAGIVLFLALLSWYLHSVITNVSWIYAVLIIYAWIKKSMTAPRYISLILLSYLLINIIITIGFIAEHNFLSKRYLIATSLTLMFWAPFGLASILQQWPKKWSALVVIIILWTALGGLIDFGYSKKYIHQAGDWLKSHVSLSEKMYANDIQLKYYSGHYGDSVFLEQNDRWKNYDVIALRLSRHELITQSTLMNEITYPLVMTFSNKRGDQVRIYRRVNQ